MVEWLQLNLLGIGLWLGGSNGQVNILKRKPAAEPIDSQAGRLPAYLEPKA